MNQVPLQIGEIVHISTVIDKVSHVLLSSGFTNKNVLVSPNLQGNKAENTRNGFFMILPSGNFEIHDEVLKTNLND